ncbi:hypothetical protein PR202_gb14780 [Eleusine coracana subsp. coracana]|uniref:BP28 C-terminal domain-containing protein n=1 Tax=Eleusine coracana subsp. coracana TaxID=191504 RepID=A0AAV5EXA2_ELECO|nr:hypothetical protein PR202_gb14780 [Eleusine coracana subsp. coracana]
MSSIAAQLQAIKSAVGAAPEPARRPITRPSVLFDAKEAADIDLRAILPIALSGLEHLASVDERFARYNNTLFSETSLDVNREQLTPKENEKINKSISTYLRLLAGYLQLPAALKTLEYLIRRYLVHVYNLDELLLSALPYHDTHAFVRIVQLVNLGNSKWTFLGGVKSSGAPPPRSFLVQQCIRDKAMLETLCNYVTPTKDFNHSRTVVCFCTAVIVECLGAVPKLDTDIVQRVLGFVFDSLNPALTRDQDYKSQSVHDLPKKPLMILKDIRDLSGVLSVLSSEYNTEKFIRLYVEALIDYSTSDDSCHTHLIETIETLPLKNSVERIAFKKHEINPMGGGFMSELFGLVFDKSDTAPTEISDSNIWFSLEHPKQYPKSAGGSKASKASDIAISCLERMVMEYQSHPMDQAKEVALVVFPLLIVNPKTFRVNLKALELAKKIQWEFYTSSSLVYDEVTADKTKNLDPDSIALINMKNIKAFAKTLLADPNMHVEWLINSGNGSRFSRTLFLLIVLQTLVAPSEVLGKQLSLCQACLPALKDEWCHIKPKDNGAGNEINIDKLEKCSVELVKHIFNSDSEALNAKILLCLFWGILRVHSSYIQKDSMVGIRGNTVLHDLFLFFITSPGKNIFQKHLQYLILNCTGAPFQFILKYFLDEDLSDGVQMESLLVLASVFSKCASSEYSSLNESTCMQLLLGFPSIILPLAHGNKDIRSSAVKCIEGLSLLWQRMSTSPQRNGNNIKLPQCMSSPTFGMFLESLLSQKTMISSDATFLPAYISSMLSPHKDMMVPDNLHERFDQPTKDSLLHFILRSAMKLSPYGKFMALSVLKGVGSTLFQAEDVKSLFFNLLDRHDQYWNRDYSVPFLSTYEIQILCLLLEVLFSMSDCANIEFRMFKALLRSLRVDALSPDDPIVVLPCVTVLQTLQPLFFDELKTDIKVHASTVVKFIDLIVALDGTKGHPKRVKRQEDQKRDTFNILKEFFGEHAVASILVSLLDILFLKKDVKQRSSLLQPLFQILSRLLTDEWVSGIVCQYNEQHDTSETPDSSSSVKEAQQLVLLVLKDITDTLHSGHNDAMFNSSNIQLLIDCVRSVKDVRIRNHGFSLIASVTKACPELVSGSMVDLFVAIGDAIKQDDSHSQRVLEDLLSVVVPSWLSRTTSIEKILQIFIKALADISEHRRLALMVYLLRTLGTESSLSTVIMHLFHSLLERVSHPSLSAMSQEWECGLAISVTDQCSYTLWFPCLSKLLKEIRLHKRQGLPEMLLLAMRYILVKLEDTELNFELESKEAADFIQGSLGELLEEVILCTVITKDKKRDSSDDIMKEVREYANTVLKIITVWMSASTYFRGITQLLDHSDSVVKRKTLGILSETARGNSLVQNKQRKARKLKHSSLMASIKVDQDSGPCFSDLCLKILVLIDRGIDSDSSVKIAAISALETLAKEYPLDNPTYSNCLAEIIHHIGSGDIVTSSASVRTAGALINVLGSKALPQLPLIMKNIMLGSHQVSCCPSGNYADGCTRTSARLSSQTTTMLLSVLTTIEVIVEKLGEFVNPYLAEILDLVVLHPECGSHMDAKLDAKAADVRNLLTEKVPVRLILPPLLNMPLFLRSLEWAESEIDESSSRRSLDRAIVFYKLVNKLAEQHRSLFTPYFKYLLEGSVQYLSEDGALANSKQKKKKAKLEDAQVEEKDKQSGPRLWILRALILKSLHKCFLYDNDQKILDSSSRSAPCTCLLLKPIVSQFVVEPPECTKSVMDTPSVEEVDETLVLCLGQMAVTARSDILWKPLNHEVLMQTRSDKIRPKMLGLKVVRYMLQHLKEEYVVLLPETIPFLGELLEDVELPVKTLSQEILKEMETLSGESLRQYL